MQFVWKLENFGSIQYPTFFFGSIYYPTLVIFSETLAVSQTLKFVDFCTKQPKTNLMI